ncbi:hypothetical protein [Rathayibacter soli]|nr:hypothetical protein [Glaciibacter superstes]
MLWLVALALLLAFAGAIFSSGSGWLVWTAVIGCALGILGLVILQVKRR